VVPAASDIQFMAGQDGGGLNESLTKVNCGIFPDFGFTEKVI
jgi:hypothetical protein